MNKNIIVHILFCMCLLSACPRAFARTSLQEADTSVKQGQWQLHSKEPFRAVHIPFVFRQGSIVIEAILSGKRVECRVDTGFNGITWDSRLDIPSLDTGKISMGLDGAGHQTPYKLCVLPSLQLGGYELKTIPSYCFTSDTEKKPAAEIAQLIPSLPSTLLGNLAFKNIVLTIDYQKRELVLRSPDYDVFRQRHSREAQTFKIKIVENDISNYGVAICAGTIFGTPVRFLLDTGWASHAIGITDTITQTQSPLQTKLADHKLMQGMPITFISGVAVTPHFALVDFCLGTHQSIEVQRDALQFFHLYTDVDAIIGNDILQYFCVTFDYTRKKVLLDPYEADFRSKLKRNAPDQTIDPGVRTNTVVVNGKTYTIPKGMMADIDLDGSVKFVPLTATPNPRPDKPLP